MIDLLFGTHVAGWQAMAQFAIWTSLFMFLAIRWLKKQGI